jgi:purine-binding chemotaxis protein CheW
MRETSQFCTFYLDKLLFGVDLKAVQEVIRELPMTPVPLAPPVVSGSSAFAPESAKARVRPCR